MSWFHLFILTRNHLISLSSSHSQTQTDQMKPDMNNSDIPPLFVLKRCLGVGVEHHSQLPQS